MRIVVCIKHVPDVQSERRLEGGRLVRGEDDVEPVRDSSVMGKLKERFSGR